MAETDGHSVRRNDILAVEEYLEVLTDLANNKKSVSYEKLLSLTKVDNNVHHVGRRVEYLKYFTERLYLPDLRVLVVSKDSETDEFPFGIPGYGYMEDPNTNLPTENPELEILHRQHVVFDYSGDWHSDKFQVFASWLGCFEGKPKKSLPIWQPYKQN